jgi:hypothetical protein
VSNRDKHTHKYMHRQIHTHKHTHKYIHKQIHTLKYIHTQIHTHKYIHVCHRATLGFSEFIYIVDWGYVSEDNFEIMALLFYSCRRKHCTWWRDSWSRQQSKKGWGKKYQLRNRKPEATCPICFRTEILRMCKTLL